MKKIFTLIAIIAALNTQAQSKDSLVLQITMDTTTFKNVVQLIQENINGQTASGKVLLQNILAPLYQFKLVANKPKDIKN